MVHVLLVYYGIHVFHETNLNVILLLKFHVSNLPDFRRKVSSSIRSCKISLHLYKYVFKGIM